MTLTQEQSLWQKVQAGVSVDTRTLYITGPVDHALAHRVITALEALDATDGEIRIVLNSEGGEEQPGYAIYDAITMCRNRVVIDGYGSVMSIAAAIFQAGDVRRLSPNADYMIHNGTIDTEETVQQDEILTLADQVRRGADRYYNILIQGSQQPLETIEEWCKEEKTFDAEEAVQAGFADEVLKPLKTKLLKKKRRRRK